MKDTYDIRDLMARYSCAASTIYRLMKNDGYPRPSRVLKGSRNVWAMLAVHAWEREHMPQLHPSTDEVALMEESEQWVKLRRDYERRLNGETIPVRAKGGRRWKDVEREQRALIADMKKRHGQDNRGASG
jgi:predicted DNA-binding transcriptional regulator AlpA